MTLELYVFPPSPRAFKVLAVAAHLGLDYVLKPLNLLAGDQRKPDFVAINPNMRMPALKEGDFTLWEANAIVQYLALKKPESGLLPLDERQRIDVTRWQFWDLAHWDSACAAIIFENFLKGWAIPDAKADPQALAAAEEKFHFFANVLDGQLAGRRFVTGDALTVADFSLGAALNMTARARLPVAPYAEIGRWYASLSALPAWQRTLADSALPAVA